jgi:hypothetical protein
VGGGLAKPCRTEYRKACRGRVPRTSPMTARGYWCSTPKSWRPIQSGALSVKENLVATPQCRRGDGSELFQGLRNGGDIAPFVTGKLAELIRWGTAAQSNWRLEDRIIEIRKLEVTGINGGSADAKLDAEERVNLVMDDLKGPMTMSYSGPMHLEFVGGNWKVADYTMNGSSLCDEIVCHEESTSSHGLELLPRLSIVRSTTVSVLFSLRNLRSSALWASEGLVRNTSGTNQGGRAVGDSMHRGRRDPYAACRFCDEGVRKLVPYRPRL